MATPINNKTELQTKVYVTDHPKLVVLEFMVSWSELCKFMSPAVEELAKKYKEHADFYTLDTDKFKQHAREKGVEVLPTFLLWKNGHECARIVCVNKKDLEDSIREHTGLPQEDDNHESSESKDEVTDTTTPQRKDSDCIIL